MKKIICVAEKSLPLHTVKYPSGLSFRFLPGGDLYDIRNGEFMVNLYTGTVFDRSPPTSTCENSKTASFIRRRCWARIRPPPSASGRGDHGVRRIPRPQIRIAPGLQ